MRKSTISRLLVLLILVGVVGVTGLWADGKDTQTCEERCETSYNQCMAQAQWWNVFWMSHCAEMYTYCLSNCGTGGIGGGGFHQDF